MVKVSVPDVEMLELTAEQLGTSLRIPALDAYLLIQFGERRGWIRRIGVVPSKPGQRARGAAIYAIPIDLGERLAVHWGKRQGVQ
jgi:hypothetical protein